jgi:hypothetical protein
MKGDFSQWKHDPNQNFSGVLHQQGRVLLDTDWNAQTQITSDWQDTAARDAFGPGVAAVPAGDRDAFRVVKAVRDSGTVTLSLLPGRLWADGLLVQLQEDRNDDGNPITESVDSTDRAITRRTATYLPRSDGHSDGTRDAVILEVWREAINGFQLPDDLIEPALGGPDTTERMHTAMALKLYRLGPGETCETIRQQIQDDFAAKGKLTVSLHPTTATTGDCPVTAKGGYTGFEHSLYRIEIAQVNSDSPMFKYSRFNGGLVGRGNCDLSAADKKITITANKPAIVTSDLNQFYLEVLEEDRDRGHWRVTYGAEATLNGDDLEITAVHYSESSVPSGDQFFRLWDGIKLISGFPPITAGSEPTALDDGIRLEFDTPSSTIFYKPGDYWTFAVRAGEIENLPILINHEPPAGIHYHRVPLAEITWGNAVEIEDCRYIFRPLTNQKVCCSLTVGDGKTSHGDVNSIEEAIARLPWWGGEICLLPGLHLANVEIKAPQFNIKIKGCGLQTWVFPNDRSQPIFKVSDSWYITFENMALVHVGNVAAIQVEGSQPFALNQIEIAHNHIVAFKHAIHVKQGSLVTIHHNHIFMLDRLGGDVAVYLQADDSRIERNLIMVPPLPQQGPRAGAGPSAGLVELPDLTDDCVDPESVSNEQLRALARAIIQAPLIASENPFKAHGGLQIGSGSDRVNVAENPIWGGLGNGITLGSHLEATDFSAMVAERPTIRTVQNFEVEVQNNENQSLGGVLLVFVKGGGQQLITKVTQQDGSCRVESPASANYEVFSASPNYKITSIEQIRDPGRVREPEVPRYRITVEPINELPIALTELLAPITEVLIENNPISYMGLSGIGTPQRTLATLLYLWTSNRGVFTQNPPLVLALVLAKQFGVLSGFVMNVKIQNNNISHCLQNIVHLETLFGAWMQGLLMLRGEGGISLSMCENLVIRENRLEENGRSYIDPVCGIFVSYAAQVEINQNQIFNNGPLQSTNLNPPKPGIRGGIVLTMTTSILMPSFLDPTNTATGIARVVSALGGYAARLHDNPVKQPFGQALRMFAIGPVSVVNNQFVVDFSAFSLLDLFAGTVLIMNLGRPIQYLIDNGQTVTLKKRPDSLFWFPTGNTLFNNNQTKLMFSCQSFTSQMIVTGDDLKFSSNQSEVIMEFNQSQQNSPPFSLNDNGISTPFINRPLKINTVLLANTVQADNNRLAEPMYELYSTVYDS